MKNLFLVSLLSFMVGCSNTTQKSRLLNLDAKSTNQFIENLPKIDLKISLKDSIFNVGDNIFINISLTNNGTEVQKILFDKPLVSTDGPWGIIGEVIEVETKRSVVKYKNKAILSSQLYTEDELKDHYYYLKAGQTINGLYKLEDIVVFNASINELQKGSYEVQLFYFLNASNVITVRIQ